MKINECVEIETPIGIIEASKERAKKIGVRKNSIRKGEGNIYGCIGEACLAYYLGILNKDTYHYDMTYGRKSLEVKAKCRNYPPEAHWMCSVATTSDFQKCDIHQILWVETPPFRAALV
jgi:hypothetical protein